MASTVLPPRIIFVDPNFLTSSPSMRSIVLATPLLQAKGVEVEVWANRVAEGMRLDGWIKISCPALPSPLGFWVFSFLATAYRLGRFRQRSEEDRRRTVLFSTGYYSWLADYSLIHFSSWDWTKQQVRLGLSSVRELLEFGRSLMSAGVDFLMANNPKAGCFLPVSRSVAEDFRKLARFPRDSRVLPNARNDKGFSVEQRIEARPAARIHHGYGESDPVFAMTAMGHLRRKGFNNAVLGLQELRKLTGRKDIRFLFIGGTPSVLESARVWLDERIGDWHSWLKLTGMVDNVTFHLSAADAFLFPSYSEAFSLAEIEASSMGLRLYLTPHHGSEMILNAGVNGRWISWDPVEIATVLSEDFKTGEFKCHSGSSGEALTVDSYAARLIELSRKASKNRQSDDVNVN